MGATSRRFEPDHPDHFSKDQTMHPGAVYLSVVIVLVALVIFWPRRRKQKPAWDLSGKDEEQAEAFARAAVALKQNATLEADVSRLETENKTLRGRLESMRRQRDRAISWMRVARTDRLRMQAVLTNVQSAISDTLDRVERSIEEETDIREDKEESCDAET